jgi:hypothetical protein
MTNLSDWDFYFNYSERSVAASGRTLALVGSAADLIGRYAWTHPAYGHY